MLPSQQPIRPEQERSSPFEHASFPASLALFAALIPASLSAAELPAPAARAPLEPPPAGAKLDIPRPGGAQLDLEMLARAFPPLPPAIARPDLQQPAKHQELAVLKEEKPDQQQGQKQAPDNQEPARKKGNIEILTPQIPGGQLISDPGRPENIADWIKKGVIIGLGIVGAVSAIRGTAKVYQHFKENWDARNRFNRGIWFDSLNCNMHTLTEQNGKLVLDVYTFATPQLSAFIPNTYACKRFLSAAELCTENQPFPTLNYPVEYSTKKLDGLNRMNRFFKDSFSGLYHEDIIAAAVGLPTQKGTFYVIPVCEVFHRDGKEYRSLAITAVSEETFARLEDPDEVARIETDGRENEVRIRNLQYALYHQREYRKQQGVDLFPKVTVVIRK